MTGEGFTTALRADTTTLRQLGYRAVEEGWPAPSDKAFDELDPAGDHVGVLVYVHGWDGKFGSDVPADAFAIVTWALQLENKEGRMLVHIGASIDEIAKLAQVAIPADTADAMASEARSYLAALKFEGQARAELERLLRGDFTDEADA